MSSDGQELSPTPSSSSNLSNGVQRPRHTPHCGKCRNHGVIEPLRGHKKTCPRRNCECSECFLTIRRREVMKAQNDLVRQKRLEERMHGQRTPSLERERSRSPLTSYRISPGSVSPPVASQTPPRVGNVVEAHSIDVMKLIRHFGLEKNALPFAYAVLRIAGDINVAIDMVKKAQKELLPLPPYRPPSNRHQSHTKQSLYRPFESSTPLPLVMASTRGCKIPRSFDHSSA